MTAGFADGTARRWRGRDGTYGTARGANSHAASLTEAQARDILSRPATGPNRQSHASIARDLGCSESAVAHVRKGRTWAHLPRPTTGGAR